MPFYFKFRHFVGHENNTDVILCLYKMRQTDWLLCLPKNFDWFKELRNCQTSLECCRQLCVCPLIDQRQEPIKMRE